MYDVRFQHDRPGRNLVGCTVHDECGRRILSMTRPTIEHLRFDVMRTLGLMGIRQEELRT